MNAEQDRLIRQELSSLLYGGDLDGAAAGCLSHLQRRPRDHEAMALLAHVYLMAKQFREAETTLTKALRLEYACILGATRSDWILPRYGRSTLVLEAQSDPKNYGLRRTPKLEFFRERRWYQPFMLRRSGPTEHGGTLIYR